MVTRPTHSISERLRELLAFTGDSQTELAKKISVSRADISRYVNGARIPRQDKIGAISEAYNIDPAWLMGYDVPMHKKLTSTQATEDAELLAKWHRLNDMQKQAVKLTIDNFLGLLPLPEVKKP